MTLVVDASAVIDLLVRSTRGDRVRAYLDGRADDEMARGEDVLGDHSERAFGDRQRQRADPFDVA